MRDGDGEWWEDGVTALGTEMSKTDSHSPPSDIYSTPQIQPKQREGWRTLRVECRVLLREAVSCET